MKIFQKLTVVAALFFSASIALADGYPDKAVRVVVTTVPGPLDAFARAVLAHVQTRLKQPFVIDNKPGAGGNLGADMVAKSRADGYTLLFALDTTFTVNPALYKKMPFDPVKDFVPIAVPVTYSQALAVNPSSKAHSLAEFVKQAKTLKMTYATGGNGSPSHLTMAAFMAAAGIEMTHIPYKGTGASVIDVMGGQVDSVFAVGSGILPQAKAGKLRALAVSGGQRSPAAPDLPTVAESGYPGFNASFAYAFMAPAGTPDEIVQLLAREVALAMNSPEIRELNRLADYTATNLSQQQSATWLQDARKQWADLIVKAKITMD
ncbi:Bug family tripartite tricarboxylate transporter substrate binding protein [Polaromonas sp. UC242_47]|uniref:Bug family tripartite tricarboxylate transporter substrate binding protein n=1 Tax=Polaromonas sp. UC242_47 TaxID=3374626 RepID=UPI0037AE0F54